MGEMQKSETDIGVTGLMETGKMREYDWSLKVTSAKKLFFAIK